MKNIRRNSALRVVLWLIGDLLMLSLLNVIGQGFDTLDRLTFVDRERDTWQRASEIVEELNLHNGSRVVSGEADDPLISAPIDAVLIANTYHELARPGVILAHVHDALADGGRIVIADRTWVKNGPESTNTEHAIDPAAVEAELRREGFEIQTRQDHFLDQPDEGPWFLIAAVPIMRHKS